MIGGIGSVGISLLLGLLAIPFSVASAYLTQILRAVDSKLLRLTKHDDQIYSTFREEFPDFDVKNVNEEEMKSPEGKVKWRNFCEKFKESVEDYNFGTLLRTKASGDYSPENSILTTRVQFFAVEIARNREGANGNVRDLLKKQNPSEEESPDRFRSTIQNY